MKNLCCVLSPEFLCQECDLRVCKQCYNALSEQKQTKIRWHEDANRCKAGANYWVNKEDSILSASIIFGKRNEI